MRKRLSPEEESKLWKELAAIVIQNAQRETEEWLEQNGLLSTYTSLLEQKEVE